MLYCIIIYNNNTGGTGTAVLQGVYTAVLLQNFNLQKSNCKISTVVLYIVHCTGTAMGGSTAVVISLEDWWIYFVRDTCGAGTGCTSIFQK
jgi:hypothetical protein